MASTGKCQYCGATVSSEEKSCPGCGAPNPNYVQRSERRIQKPRTVGELKEYCAQHNLPLLRMRFFIDEDMREPKAFGLYRDGADFVVYKNKADGTRAERYRGPDESYAVSELYKKLLTECHARNIFPDGKPLPGASARSRSSGGKSKKSSDIALVLFVVILVVYVLFSRITDRQLHQDDGYYDFGGSGIYYLYGDDWYYSDDDSDWYSIDAPDEDYSGYYQGSDYQTEWNTGDFEDSDIWEDLHDDSSGFFDYGDDFDDDWDSWDSDDTDWDSDW